MLLSILMANALKRESKNANTKSCRTEQEELSFQFMMNHENDIQKHTISFEKAYHQAYSEKDLNKKIILLQNVIDLYEKNGFTKQRVEQFISKIIMNIYIIQIMKIFHILTQ